MAGTEKIVDLLYDMQGKIDRIGSRSQLGNTTLGGEAAVGLADVVTEAAVTNDALPDVQVDVADGNEGVSDLQANLSAVGEDLVARFEDAAAQLADKAAEIADSQQDVSDAFGLQLEGLSDRVDEIVVGAGGTLILFSDEGPDGTAPTGSTWFMINEAENIVGQWQQTGTVEDPVWTPREIESSVIANLDVGKLTAGQASIAQVVALKIAASTANIQTVNVANLFVTDGATMNQATINYLFANVVAAKKITADMLDVNSLNGVTITGAIIKSAASGQRLEIQKTRIDVFDTAGVLRGSISASGVDGAMALGPSNSPGIVIYANGSSIPTLASTTVNTDVGKIGQLIVNDGAYAEDLAGDAAIVDWRANIPLYVAEQTSGSTVSPSRLQAPQLAVYPNTKTPFIVATQRISDSKVVLIGGDFTSPNGKSVLPLTGESSYTDGIGAMSSTTITAFFPTGRFASKPTVTANGSNSRVTVGINSVSATSVTFALGNWTSALVNSVTVYWTATPTPA